ncbi:MAG TPA: endonuclease/exonuclease/phosphatase family protein [Firmicutes bacterium]|nr:endonuclease/exonuclease/phosphatase family protein [Bacillota bacterium]
MKIISWNCNGAFRKKAHLLSAYNADLYIIQECENPNKYPFDTAFLNNYLPIWTGLSDRKGLAFFVRKTLHATKIRLAFPPFHDYSFICIDHLHFLGVWTHRPNYIEDFYDFLSEYSNKIPANTVIAGDFNSNAIWDRLHKQKCHSNIVQILKGKDLVSVWHTINHIEHGKETVATHYFHKNTDNPFHIDYCFAPAKIIADMTIGSFQEWIAYSDHMPLIITFNH